MRGTHTVEFDFEFDYATKGEYLTASAIQLQAPGLKDYRLHAWITSVVNEALMNFAARNPELRKMAEDSDDGEAKSSDDTQQDALMILSGGMGGNEYPNFVEKLRKTLSNNAHLAHIVAEGNPPITDKVWESIAEKGGLTACDQVLSGFVGLFFNERLGATPPKKTGKRSRRGS